jgi:hypothetical protein
VVKYWLAIDWWRYIQFAILFCGRSDCKSFFKRRTSLLYLLSGWGWMKYANEAVKWMNCVKAISTRTACTYTLYRKRIINTACATISHGSAVAQANVVRAICRSCGRPRNSTSVDPKRLNRSTQNFVGLIMSPIPRNLPLIVWRKACDSHKRSCIDTVGNISSVCSAV